MLKEEGPRPDRQEELLPSRGKTYKLEEKILPQDYGKFYSERDIIRVSTSVKYKEKTSINLKQQVEDDREHTPEKKYDKQVDSLSAAKLELTIGSSKYPKHDSSIPHDTSIKPRKGDMTPKDDTLSQPSLIKANLSSKMA
jgi:hypothetical protein